MKKSKLFIFIFFTLLVVALAVVMVASCSHAVKAEESKIIERQNAEAKFETHYESKEAEFLVMAAEINLEEILLGQLAAEKGTHAEVKNLGKLLIKAHELSLKEVTALAAKKSIAIPLQSQKGDKKLMEI